MRGHGDEREGGEGESHTPHQLLVVQFSHNPCMV